MTLDATSPRRTRAVAGVAAAEPGQKREPVVQGPSHCHARGPCAPRTEDVTEALESRGRNRSGLGRKTKAEGKATGIPDPLARSLATARTSNALALSVLAVPNCQPKGGVCAGGGNGGEEGGAARHFPPPASSGVFACWVRP